MYRDAGFTEMEIKGITKGGGVKTAVADILLTGASYGSATLAIIKDNLLNNIPNTTNATIATGLVYLGSFLLMTRQNLRLTEELRASANAWVTGIYVAGNRLLPEKTRDMLAQGVAITADTVTRGATLGTIAGITGDPHKIAAASAFGAAFNGILAGGSEILLRLKKRKNAKTTPTKQ